MNGKFTVVFRDMTPKEQTTFSMMIVVLAAVGMAASMMHFTVGYHNLDLGQNMRWVEQEFNTSLVDYGMDWATGEVGVHDSMGAYLMGGHQMFQGAMLLAFFSMLFEIGMTHLYGDALKVHGRGGGSSRHVNRSRGR